MAITQPALAQAIARDFARAVPPEAHLSRLWVWSEHGYIRPERDYVELTAFVDPVDEEAQKRLMEETVSLSERYPEADLMVFPIGFDPPGGRTPEMWVHPQAEEIDVRGE